ncbi:Eukaryotic porin/Tom40 [Artemisia annua]|uniref:Eukaryotic porin/Tom40 n=1 Tax=Artemisia annua TaxID=35608 RepID=A0A2U1LLL6_ARTAN|nr:Eukaryotic porin/Tom40 [Artemisia annua]
MGEDAGRQIMTLNDMVHHGMKGYVGEFSPLRTRDQECGLGPPNGDGMHLSLKKNGPMISPLWYLVVKLRMVCLMVMRLVPKEMTLVRPTNHDAKRYGSSWHERLCGCDGDGMHLSLKKNGPMISPLWYLAIEAEDGMLNGDETHAKRNDLVRLYKNDKGESLNSWYYQIVKPLNHKFATNLNTITFGTQHALDPLTIVKARYDNLGKPNALIQYDWRPKSLFTI